MNKTILTIAIALACFLSPVIGMTADEPDSLTGRIGFGAIFIDSANNLSPSGSDERLDSLDQSPDRKASAVVGILPEVTWDIGQPEGTKLYLSSDPPIDEAGSFVLNIGGATTLPQTGILDAGLFFAPFEKAWENPYLTGTDRDETSNPKYGARIALNRIGGTGLRVNLVYVRDEVEDDRISDLTPQLGRDGAIYAVNLNYSIPAGPNLEIRPRLSLRKGEYDGEANSFAKYKVELEARYMVGRLMLMPRAHYSYSEYDEVHPIFNTTRNNNSCGFQLISTYMAPFGLRNWSLMALLSFSEGKSNIDFYDTESLSAGAFVNYSF